MRNQRLLLVLLSAVLVGLATPPSCLFAKSGPRPNRRSHRSLSPRTRRGVRVQRLARPVEITLAPHNGVPPHEDSGPAPAAETPAVGPTAPPDRHPALTPSPLPSRVSRSRYLLFRRFLI
jgi:hypothetical protein